MKSDRKKRILAAILCMVMVLSGNISALAEGEVYADPDAVTQMETPEAVSETQPESAPQEPAAEEPPVSTEPAAPEAPAENNEPAAPETPAGNNEPAAPETPVENNEPATPETPEAPEEEDPVFSEETELTKELRDASGKLVQKVTAKLPKGAFEAETSQIEMEVTYVDSSMENYIKGMMEKKLPTDNTLGDYFLYNIQFKVNGEAKESLEPITITFEKSNLEIKDTKKANVFFFDPANPEVSGDKDELVEITQRSELLESLQAAGQSTATMEEDYDLSSIEIKEENRSGKIVLEGRKSTIYGCYVEKGPEQKEETPEEQTEEKPADIPVLNYEDDKVTVSVTAEEAGIIPEGAELKVVPITSEDTDTKEQYKEVEKKIQEKVAEEEKEVAGFLAYDITFVDKDGNEMEPNGKVKVSMNYKKAELPPEVVEKKATDAEVTVLHLEEDENGEVKQVVDMGAEQKANVDTLTTTEGTKVQNVAVETESFSVFTITWLDKKDKLTIHYVNDKYQEITDTTVQTETVVVEGNQEIDLFYFAKSIAGYSFSKKVTIGKENSASSLRYVKYQNGLKWSETSWSWNSWSADQGYHVYLIYIYNAIGNVTDSKIETIDNRNKNITINLFDYTLYDEEGNKTESSHANDEKEYTNNTGINSYNSEFKFMDGSGTEGNIPDSNNKWTGTGNPRTGIVKDTLQNGYPVIKTNSDSLDYLFNPESEKNGKTTYKNVTGLLTQDQDGYYSFDSDKNYAEFHADTNSFTVYNKGLKMFYPFDLLASVNSKSSEAFHGGSVGFNYNSGINHYFGMTMSATFYQPKDGKINGKDMIFEFSGDDDVWVFIDNKLVLDLGGIHDVTTGSINFSTGEVKVNGRNDNVKDLFQATGVVSFKDYSTHTIKFFYLERGNNASNCKLNFNLPTIPENSVMVTKEVQDKNGNAVDYAEDIEYHFNIVKKPGSEGTQLGYDLYENHEVIQENLQTEENGNFVLKHGQSAVFKGFLDTDKYEVKETGASLGNGYDVGINGQSVTIKTESQTGELQGVIQSAETGELTVHKTPSVVFTNTVKDTGTLTLKKCLEETDSTEKSFDVRLKINGNLYSGSYMVFDEGDQNGVLKNTENGQISLKANQSATITGFPYGTKFEVDEILDGSYLPTYMTDITNGGLYDIQIPTEKNDLTSVMGKIAAGGTVIVTNHKVNVEPGTTTVTIKKEWDQTGRSYEELIPESIDVELYKDNKNDPVTENHGQWDGNDIKVTLDVNRSPIEAEVTLSKSQGWTYTWENLEGDVDYVVKETYPDGFKWKTTEYVNSLDNYQYVDRVQNCNNMTFNLGRNNMLLVKKGSDYVIWTPHNLSLSQEELNKIANSSVIQSLEGVGTTGTLTYEYGIQQDENGITLKPTDTGWVLEFDKKSAWSQFWCLRYSRTENIQLKNTIDEEYKTSITVNKVWKGIGADLVPETIKVKLKQDGKADFVIEGSTQLNTVTITKDDKWTYTWNNLPYYYFKEGKYAVHQYTVEEVEVGDQPLEDLEYEVSYSELNDGVITITNTKPTPWFIYKISSSSTPEQTKYLEDVEFKLEEKNAESIFYGKTNSNGLVEWYTDENHSQKYNKRIPDGRYALSETKAQPGYILSHERWTIVITHGQVTITSDVNGALSGPRYEFKNTPVYELPSTGGPGIFVYTIGGTLLLMAAALLIYKMKREEVLKG